MDENVLLEEVVMENVPDQLITIAAQISRIENSMQAIQQSISRLEGDLKRKSEAKEETLAKKKKMYCAACKMAGHETVKCRKASASQKIQLAMETNSCLNCNYSHPGACTKPPSCLKCRGYHLTAYHMQ
ncbi:unnamed protein product [Caenorhabditis nigoni]